MIISDFQMRPTTPDRSRWIVGREALAKRACSGGPNLSDTRLTSGRKVLCYAPNSASESNLISPQDKACVVSLANSI